MHRSLRDPFVVEVSDLLSEMKVLEQRRTTRTGLQGVVCIGQPQALRGGEMLAALRVRVGPERQGRPR